MNLQRCTRIWQAEAREDGRLASQDLASFERHMGNCADCSAEVRALGELRRILSSLPEPQRSDLERRRARSELLRRANGQFLGAAKAPKRWNRFIVAALPAMLLIFAVFLGLSRNRGRPGPTFEVQDLARAEWSIETKAATSRVTLRSGTAAFQVEHLHDEAQFFVELPDGRIEVRGTRFIVAVAEGHTRSVEVTEGTVMLQLPEFEGLLYAGDRWPKLGSGASAEEEAPTLQSAPVPYNSTREEPNGPIPAPTSSVHPNPLSAHTALPTSSPSSSPPSSPTPKDTAGPRFAEAVHAFTAGDYQRAETLFAAFVRDFPRDGRAEDATFLRAQARARRGDKAGAAAVAREYLRAFPHGLRRPEAERLAAEPAPMPQSPAPKSPL